MLHLRNSPKSKDFTFLFVQINRDTPVTRYGGLQGWVMGPKLKKNPGHCFTGKDARHMQNQKRWGDMKKALTPRQPIIFEQWSAFSETRKCVVLSEKGEQGTIKLIQSGGTSLQRGRLSRASNLPSCPLLSFFLSSFFLSFILSFPFLSLFPLFVFLLKAPC